MKRTLTTIALACAALAAHAQGTGPIKIVGSLDLSGPAADVGRDALAGVNHAIDAINKSGGVLGRQLVLEHQDNGSNPQRAVNQASSLLAGDPPLLIAPQSSAGAIAVNKAVTAKNKTPTCVSTSVADDMTMKDFNPYIYQVTPNSWMEGRAMAARFAKLPYKKYALVSADYAGGRAGVNRFKEFLKEMNPNVEFVVEEYPKFGATDYTASINKLLAAKPDYVFTILFGADLLTFAKQAKAVDFFKQINNKFIALYDFNTLKALGDNAPVGTEGWQRAPASQFVKTADGKAFVDQFRAKNNAYPSDWAAMAHDCVTVWAQAANAAKSIQGDAVMKQIESMEFKSARGNFRFAKYDHQGNVPTYVGKVEMSREFAQPILNITEIMPASVSRPSEAVVLKARQAN
ncbi:ABC transporter substrate-binding protein [Ramlibacter sp.]|uniref:ABC transporter substrate-binding protein n=1 Tax=Ramlibacter sp. TaxID=1917967 RepID=UPI003D124E52